MRPPPNPEGSSPLIRMDRIRIIERSLRAWVCSLIGLIPLFGAPLAVLAVVLSADVRAETGAEWNPAETYVRWAGVLGRLGLMLTGLVVFAIVAAVTFG